MNLSKIIFLTLAALIVFGFAPIKQSMAQAVAEDEATSAVSNMTEEQLGDFIRAYLLEKPEVIFEAVDVYNAREEAARTAGMKEKLDEHKDYLYSSDLKTVAGPKDASVVVVEFFDYNCGYCKKALPDVQKVLENDKDVRFVFMELPILSASSTTASQYAQAAAEQGSELYFKYHTALMEFKGSKNESSLEDIAKNVGLDVEKLKADAKSDAVTKALADNMRVSQDLGIRGTPAFIIGDFISPGYMGYDSMAQVIETARANAIAEATDEPGEAQDAE